MAYMAHIPMDPHNNLSQGKKEKPITPVSVQKQSLKMKFLPGILTNTQMGKYMNVTIVRKFFNKKVIVFDIEGYTEQKPYQCKECGKSFAKNYNFASHLKIHSEIQYGQSINTSNEKKY